MFNVILDCLDAFLSVAINLKTIILFISFPLKMQQSDKFDKLTLLILFFLFGNYVFHLRLHSVSFREDSGLM